MTRYLEGWQPIPASGNFVLRWVHKEPSEVGWLCPQLGEAKP